MSRNGPLRLEDAVKLVRAHGAELGAHLRYAFPDIAPDATFRVKTLPRFCSHHTLVFETIDGPLRRGFIKGPRKTDPGPRDRSNAELEWQILTEVGPRIRERDPRARCPEAWGMLPDVPLMLMEMVEGPAVDEVLFGFARTSVDPRTLVGLCGIWLREFHRLTRSDERGSPLEWLSAMLEAPRAREFVTRQLGAAWAARLVDAAGRLCRRHRGWRVNRCWVHDGFAAHHAMVHGSAVYVVDFSGSCSGFAYRDLGAFLAFPLILSPWRRQLGTWRLGATGLESALLTAYLEARDWSPADGVALRLARIEATVRYGLRFRAHGEWLRVVKSHLLEPIVLLQIRRALRAEILALEAEAESAD